MATRDMSTETSAPAMTLSERLAAARTWSRTRPRKTLLEEFEQLYLRNVDVLMGYFARRCGDPHTVADLTSETFVRAMDGFARFDPRRGSDRAWLFGIAAHVFARHCDQSAGGRDAVARLPAVERAAIDLVDLVGLTPKEAAQALGVSRVAFRKRLSRARSRLKREHQNND